MPIEWIFGIMGAVFGIIIGTFAGILIRKNIAERQIGSAEAQAKKLLEDAIKAAETKRK